VEYAYVGNLPGTSRPGGDGQRLETEKGRHSKKGVDGTPGKKFLWKHLKRQKEKNPGRLRRDLRTFIAWVKRSTPNFADGKKKRSAIGETKEFFTSVDRGGERHNYSS